MKNSLLFPALLLPLACALPQVLAAPKTTVPKTAAPATQTLQGDARIVHALNRLSFGPRPGDVEKVRAMGLGQWIAEQLHPETIDDKALEAELKPLSLLRATPETLALAYKTDNGPIGKMLREAARQKLAPQAVQGNGKRNLQKKAILTGKTPANSVQNTMRDDATTLNAAQMADWQQIQKLGFKYGESNMAVGQLVDGKIARAIDSKKQLQEVLVDFWSNHFNLDVRKGPVQTLKLVDDREAIRPHVFGTFRELLGASAKSPAMLLYLDNANSTVTMNNRRKKQRGGINENYARELMELHTLGVDGGYTQKDVQEVARCFTGWSLNRDNGTFQFRPFAHDNDAKTVLGQAIPAGGGIGDGERVLDILATQPAAAKFLSAKLCRRLVNDEPSPQLVARIAAKWRQSGGDLRMVVAAIAYDPEFTVSTTRAAKIKSPFEFAVSGVRALGGSFKVPDPKTNYGRLRLIADGAASMQRGGGNRRGRGDLRTSLAQAIADMGQPLFGYQAPTGYSENSQNWVSTGALVARLNFALDLAGNEIAHIRVEPENVFAGVSADDHNAVLNRAGQALLNAPLSARTRTTLQKQLPENTPADATRLVALVLGSPEFQRR